MDRTNFSMNLFENNEIDYNAFTLAYQDTIFSICRRYSRDDHDARDLTQDFFVDKIIGNDLINKYKLRVEGLLDASQPKIPFRKYLYRSVTYFCIQQGRKQSKSKVVNQDPVEFDFFVEEREGIDQVDLEYAVSLLHRTFSRVRNYYEERQKLHHWLIFKENTLDPFIKKVDPEQALSNPDDNLSDDEDSKRKQVSRRVQEIRQKYLPESSSNQQVFDICSRVKSKVVSTFDMVVESEAFNKADSQEKDEIFQDWVKIFRRCDESLLSALSAAILTSPKSDSLASISATQSLQMALSLPNSIEEITPEEMSYLLIYRKNMPLVEWIDSKQLVDLIPKHSEFAASHPSSNVRRLSIEVLFDPLPDEASALANIPVVELLKLIKSHSRKLASNQKNPIPSPIFGLFYTLTSVIAFDRYQERIFSITDQEMHDNIRWYISKDWVDERIKKYFQQFQTKSQIA